MTSDAMVDTRLQFLFVNRSNDSPAAHPTRVCDLTCCFVLFCFVVCDLTCCFVLLCVV